MAKSKLPYFPFYPGDWLSDPAVARCSLATRGVWIDLLAAMHQNGRTGELSGTPEQLARVARCQPVEISAALVDLDVTGAAKVTERNGIITVQNRRMAREAKEREGNRIRAERYREKRPRHEKVTPPLSSSYSLSESVVSLQTLPQAAPDGTTEATHTDPWDKDKTTPPGGPPAAPRPETLEDYLPQAFPELQPHQVRGISKRMRITLQDAREIAARWGTLSRDPRIENPGAYLWTMFQSKDAANRAAQEVAG